MYDPSYDFTFNEYQSKAIRTLAKYSEAKLQLATLALGLTGESGEVADLIKKHVGHGHKLDEERVIDELGDVLWYIACLSESLGISMEDIAEKNIKKLRQRYPDGFSTEKSINRAS